MARAGQSVRAKREDRAADLAHERAVVTDDSHEVTEPETAPVAGTSTWLRLQRGNPSYNPWVSPRFLVDAWSLASDDVEVPLLHVLPAPDELARMRVTCGLSVEAVAERASVSADAWAAFEAGDETVRRHVNELQLLKFASVMAACVAAGGPPVPVAPGPRPERPPMKVVGAELLEELAREIGDRFPLHHVIVDDASSVRIVRGELPSPTATSYPSEKEMAEICLAIPGLANRIRSVRWTNSSLLQDLVDGEPTDAEYVPRDELGVGKSGLLRIIGCARAIVDSDPDRVTAIKAASEAAAQRRQDQEAAALKARAAVAQANAIIAKVEADKAAAAVEGAA